MSRGAPSTESRLGRFLTADQILQLMERRAKNAPSQIERRIRSELQQTFEEILRDPELVQFIRDQEASRENEQPLSKSDTINPVQTETSNSSESS